MSMPSSSELVATTHRSRPDLRSSSMVARCSLDTDPWCARARSGTGSSPSSRSPLMSFNRDVSRSASSDRGSQYASTDYQALLAARGIRCSMSRRGNCWDNAVVESFFATLKRGLVHRQAWPTRSSHPRAGGLYRRVVQSGATALQPRVCESDRVRSAAASGRLTRCPCYRGARASPWCDNAFGLLW